MVRRRHLRTEGRTLTGLDDEALDLAALPEDARRTLVGEAALLAALDRERTGRMDTVVATIQAEQDRVIRAPLPGALVVQGGPGTGKTVTALHRAAYLLYTHRAVLERRGILVIGPNPAFLRYIGRVLPELGETGVVLRTVGELFPGVRATGEDAPATAAVKGGPWMADVVERAVAAHQLLPDGDPVALGGELRLPRRVCAEAREAARGLRLPHNRARVFFLRTLLDALAVEQSLTLGHPYDEEEARYAPRELWAQPDVRARLDALWPVLTPHRLIDRLLSDPGLLAAAAPGLAAAERRALLRPPGSAWTAGDVPLLDEAAELLGEDPSVTRARARAADRAHADDLRYARGVLTGTGQSDDPTLDAELLAERFHDAGPYRSTAERAGADRSWAYGHVVVDEAQELSAMAWRAVMRRVPARSLTVVGDLAQTGSPAGARSWAEVMDRELPGRWREERLTVNYRTPAAVMALAAAVLRVHDPARRPPESVRSTDDRPRAVPVPDGDYAAALAGLPAAPGTLGVIAPDALAAGLGALTVRACKGLEFDSVVLVDPAGLLAQGPSDLYVALTRAARRLTLLHHGPLPAPLAAELSAQQGQPPGEPTAVASPAGTAETTGTTGAADPTGPTGR